MKRNISLSVNTLLGIGVLGCILMASSDWLMIYGDPTFEGNLAWLTLGVAAITPWRFSLALALAFPAVICYAVGLFTIARTLCEGTAKKQYQALMVIGMTPWLCLHLFYVMILFLFNWMTAQGFGDQAFATCEALFAQFAWVVIVGEVFMLLPFIYHAVLIARKKTVFPSWMFLNNPLTWYILLKVAVSVLPTSAFGLAWTNGLMSESMCIWFILFIVYLSTHKELVTKMS